MQGGGSGNRKRLAAFVIRAGHVVRQDRDRNGAVLSHGGGVGVGRWRVVHLGDGDRDRCGVALATIFVDGLVLKRIRSGEFGIRYVCERSVRHDCHRAVAWIGHQDRCERVDEARIGVVIQHAGSSDTECVILGDNVLVADAVRSDVVDHYGRRVLGHSSVFIANLRTYGASAVVRWGEHRGGIATKGTVAVPEVEGVLKACRSIYAGRIKRRAERQGDLASFVHR